MQKFTTIEAADLRERLMSADRPVLVNALAREAFEEERIPGSISIPASEAVRLAGDILAKDQAIVVYCASKHCTASPTLAQKLVDLGYTQVTDFDGGIKAWEHAGLPVERARVAVAF